MAQFEVQIPNRRLDVVLGSAAEAYQWLDDHAEVGERYQINAIAPHGGVVAIDVDFYAGTDQDPPRRVAPFSKEITKFFRFPAFASDMSTRSSR